MIFNQNDIYFIPNVWAYLGFSPLADITFYKEQDREFEREQGTVFFKMETTSFDEVE